MFKKIFKKQFSLVTTFIFVVLFFCLNLVNVNADAMLVSVKDNEGISDVGRETLEMLLTLESLKLDDSIFDKASFKSLVDFSIELATKEIGRENPFKDITYKSSAEIVEKTTATTTVPTI